MPTSSGIATINDKDIWIYAISKLMEAINKNEDVSRTIQFTTYNFLVTTNRGVSGADYQRVKQSLNRLSGTRIQTTIKTAGITTEEDFNLIQSWKIVREDNTGKVLSLEITLPEWLYRSVLSKECLKISNDYFRIARPIDKRIYEIARKHCGTNASWTFNLSTIHEKSGSTASLKGFRQKIKDLIKSNDLPDYEIFFDQELDQVIFKNRDPKAQERKEKSQEKAANKKVKHKELKEQVKIEEEINKLTEQVKFNF